MKTIAKVLLFAAMTVAVGACSSNDSSYSQQSTTTSASSGYSK